MPMTPPPDDAVQDVPPDKQEAVLGSLGRIVGGTGRTVLNPGGGGSFENSGLAQDLQRHHQQRIAQAGMYHQNMATTAAALHMIERGINPETSQPFGPSEDKASIQQKYQAQYDDASEKYAKIVGVNKETKQAAQRNKMLVDHAIKSGGRMQPPPERSLSQYAPAPQIAPDGTATTGGGLPETNAAGPKMTPPPAPPQQDNKPQYDQSLLLPDLRRKMAEQQEDQRLLAIKKQEAQTAHDYKMAEIKEAGLAKASNPTGRASAISPISISEARKLADKGMTFKAADGGDDLNLEDYDDTMMLVPLQQNGKIVGYSPASQKQTHLTFNNQVVAVPSLNQMDAANGAGTTLGAHTVPITTTRTAPGMTLSGEIGNVTTSSTRTPQGGAATGGSGPARPSRPTPPPGPSGGASPQPPAGSGADRAIPFAAQNQISQRIVPVREAATQIFGDPTQPDMKSLKDFADISDDPKERQELGNAVKMTFDGIERAEANSGGLMALLKNYGGVPQAVVDSQTQVLQDVIGKLTPRNREAYNSIMSSYGASIGLRSLTKASASQFSTKAIERELPVPGLNTFSKEQYYDQLSHLAEQVYNGTRMLPMPKSEKDYYASKVKEFRSNATKGGTTKPKTDLSKLSPEAQKWIASHGSN